jgi:hypothetical protein
VAAAWALAVSGFAQEPAFVTVDGHRVRVRTAGVPAPTGV